jgi:hypothetical protein
LEPHAVAEIAYSTPGAPNSALSLIAIEGRVADQLLRLEVYSVPPQDAGPGFRQFSDGRRETV